MVDPSGDHRAAAHRVAEQGDSRRIDVLQLNPLIGRPAGAANRELVIGQRSRGYLVLYRCIAAIDTVFVLATRSQSEAGYAAR